MSALPLDRHWKPGVQQPSPKGWAHFTPPFCGRADTPLATPPCQIRRLPPDCHCNSGVNRQTDSCEGARPLRWAQRSLYVPHAARYAILACQIHCMMTYASSSAAHRAQCTQQPPLCVWCRAHTYGDHARGVAPCGRTQCAIAEGGGALPVERQTPCEIRHLSLSDTHSSVS